MLSPCIRLVLAAVTALCVAPAALGANLPASQCQIYLKKVGAAPSSHGSGSMPVVAHVGWIGNGETIERVGFYGYNFAEDLGNDDSCHWAPAYDDRAWKIYDLTAGGYDASAYGDYTFSFPIRSGSVVGSCPGWHYSWVGTFFVQTNKNTYWLNPDMHASKYFYFDDNGFDILERRGAWQGLSTTRDDMRYYNPAACH